MIKFVYILIVLKKSVCPPLHSVNLLNKTKTHLPKLPPEGIIKYHTKSTFEKSDFAMKQHILGTPYPKN